MFQDLTTLVLDIGTQKSKIGYGGDDAPKLMVNSFVSRNGEMDIQGERKYIVGDKYLNMARPDKQIQSIYRYKEPSKCELDFQKYEFFVEHMLKQQLRVNLPDYSILLSQDVSLQPHQMRTHRQKIAEFMFQRLGVSNVYFLKSPVLSCFATGRSTALVCDSGDAYTRVVSVHDGYCLTKSARYVPYAGDYLTKVMRNQVEKTLNRDIPTLCKLSGQAASNSFNQFHINEVVRDIKDSFSSKQTEQGIEDFSTIEYELPDNKKITVNKNDMLDKLLNCQIETINNYNYRGIPTMISDNVNSSDIDIKKQLYSNMLLVGGNMLFSNIMQQIISKVNEIAPPNAKVKGVAMVSPNQRKYAGWIGGSIVTSLSSFQSYWVGRQEWKEHGINIIQKKCN